MVINLIQINNILLPYQKHFLSETSRYIVVEKARRVGFTWCLALWSVLRRIDKKIDHSFVSANLNASKEFIRYVRFWCEAINLSLGYEYIPTATITSECVEMPNGSRIMALSSNPTALRGKGGDVTLDEFAFHEQQAELLAAATPVIMWGQGVLVVCSTHNGPITEFNKIIAGAKAGTNGYNHIKVDLLDAVKDGLALKVPGEHQLHLPDIFKVNAAFVDQIKLTAPSLEVFKQEYMCETLGLQSLISEAEYDKVALWDVPEQLDQGKKYNPLYVGVDLGRTRDATVIWIAELFNNPKARGVYDKNDFKTVAIKRIQNVPLDVQLELITQLISHKSVDKVLVDQGLLGRYISDALTDRFPGIVEPFVFTSNSKQIIAERLSGYVKQERISLPKDKLNRDDILALRRLQGNSGGVSYDGRTAVSHCDGFWAAAMALHAAEKDITLGTSMIAYSGKMAKEPLQKDEPVAS